MVEKTKYYKLGDEHSAQEWASIAATLAQAQRTGEQVVEQTYLDTFDWAFCQDDVTLSVEKMRDQTWLKLRSDGSKIQFPDTLAIDEIPKWPADLPKGKMRKYLASKAGLRSLLILTQVRSEQIVLHVVDKKERHRVRLIVEVNFQKIPAKRRSIELGCRLRVECLAGYEKDFAKIVAVFAGLNETSQMAFFESLMENEGKTPKDYSSKLKISLDRDMRADEACKAILLDQLNQIERNVEGTIKDIDSEFLHDLRVAVRRSRSALSRIKGVLPATVEEKFSKELSWVGSITTPVRDLDVYLLDFPKYRDQLREDLQEDLGPLHTFLKINHKRARAQLVTDLQSRRFKDFLSKWRAFLEKPVPVRPTAEHAGHKIGDIADKRIWKTYRKVIAEGSAIGEDTPAEALHDLRKTCKKLRYVLEFFASLYSSDDVGLLVKKLKGLQENLGDFQDLDVQATTLHDYSVAMMGDGISDPKVYLAMGVLVEQFMARKADVRHEFGQRFEAFSSKETDDLFRKLVGREDVKKITVTTAQ